MTGFVLGVPREKTPVIIDLDRRAREQLVAGDLVVVYDHEGSTLVGVVEDLAGELVVHTDAVPVGPRVRVRRRRVVR